MIIDVVGSGPSCYDFEPCGNITVGTGPGIIKSKPDWLMMQDEYGLNKFTDDKYEAIAPVHLSIHAIHILKKRWDSEKRDKFLSKVTLKKLTKLELSKIPKPFKFSELNIIKFGRDYEWDLPISCGCMAVLFAIIKHNPSHVRCWGFDAHKCGNVVDLDHHLNRSDGYAKFDVSNLRRNREEIYTHDDTEDHENRGFLWQRTLEKINSYFPKVMIELM